MQTKLVAGKIPAHTECPFRANCPMAANNTCHHKGTEHNRDFSCGAARAYDLIERNEAEHARRTADKNNAEAGECAHEAEVAFKREDDAQ